MTIMKGDWKIRVEKAIDIPLTFRGKALFNVANTLPTILASFIQGFKIEDIKIALSNIHSFPYSNTGSNEYVQV